MISPTPTRRFVIEPSLICNIKCKFCYHLHRYDTWKDTLKPLPVVMQEIDAGIDRGNDYMDITGGEPTIYPHIIETVKYALSKGIRSCIITNGLGPLSKVKALAAEGLDEWLISRHGLEETHNFITNRPNAYNTQLQFLRYVSDKKMSLRFNCVINRYNQHEIFDIAEELIQWKPRIVNFIHFNPHHSWKDDMEGTKAVTPNLDIVEPLLSRAIIFLEANGIGVNVRYYPMCRVSLDHRKNICNDLHVMFDPMEWDYSTTPKVLLTYYRWGVNTSYCNEEKGNPCCTCDLQQVCGGMNKFAHAANTALYGEQLQRVRVMQTEELKGEDFYHYRQENELALIPR